MLPSGTPSNASVTKLTHILTTPGGWQAELADFLDGLSSDEAADQWYRNLDLSKGQGFQFLRESLAIKCYWEDRDLARSWLVAAVPFCHLSANAEVTYDAASADLFSGITFVLKDANPVVRAALAPAEPDWLLNLGVTNIRREAQRWTSRKYSGSPAPAKAFKPLLWPFLLEFDTAQKEHVAQYLFSAGPASHAFRVLCNRVEALLEGQGAAVKLLPPAAAWTANSIARLSTARLFLQYETRVAAVELFGGAALFFDKDNQLLNQLPVPGDESIEFTKLISMRKPALLRKPISSSGLSH